MTQEDLKRRLGARESGEDERDLPFAFLSIEKVEVPERFSIKDKFLDIRYQDDIPACTAFATSSILEALKKITYYVSPRDIYCRRSNASPGMSLRNACSVLKKEGTCREICFPFVPNNAIFCTQKPCANDAFQRSNHKIASYHRIYTSIKSTIWQEKTPILVAIPVYENWENVKSDGVIPPPDGSAYIGLHAVTFTGWKKINDKTYYEFRNSWGEKWGDKGHGYLPLSYPIQEAWSMKIGETNGEDRIEVQSWQIGKKNLFGVSVSFSIVSPVKCKASLFVNDKKRGFTKRIRKGINPNVVFNIPFELNEVSRIKLAFITSGASPKFPIGVWYGTLNVKCEIDVVEAQP